MRIRWHIPSFMDFEPPPPTDYDSQDELLRVVRIRELMAEPWFDHWEVSEYEHGSLLMMITTKGEFWVIGYLPTDHGLMFPKWTPP